MIRDVLDMRLNRKQREGLRALRDSSKQYVLFDGGIRSGKTELLWDWLVARAIAYPGSKQIVIRKEKKQHDNGFWGPGGTIGRFFYRTFDEHGLKSLYTLMQTDRRVEFWNKSVIRLEGCDTPEHVGRILGDEYITMWFNEAFQMDYDVVTELWDRVAQKCYAHPIVEGKSEWFPPQANKQVIFDTNPRGKRHWLYKAGVLNVDPIEGGLYPFADKWVRVGGWKPWDNQENVNTDGMENKTGVARARMIDGEWCDNEGAVYEEFNEDMHVCAACDGNGACPKVFGKDGRVLAKGLYRGIDFGWNDPTVCLWVANIGGQLLVYRCHYKKQKMMSRNAELIKAAQQPFEPIKWTVIDHQPEYAEQLRKAGIPNRNAHKDNPIMGGCDRVKARLTPRDGVPGLLVCRYCSPVIEEFSSYMMDAKKDAPEDKNNHCMDALRYIVAEVDNGRGSVAVFM